MTRPRSISLSSDDDVRELSPEEIARLAAARPGRSRDRRQRAQPAARPEVIVISDSDSPVRNRPSFQARLAQANAPRNNDRNPRHSPNAPSDRITRQLERWRRVQAQAAAQAEMAARQEQVLASLPLYAALGIDIDIRSGRGIDIDIRSGPAPAIRRQARRGSHQFARRPAPYAVRGAMPLVHRFLVMPHGQDAFDSMSYDELLELGRRVGEVRPRGADPKKIAKLRKRKWKGLKAKLPPSSESQGCAICIEDFVDTDMVNTLACNHMFHVGCSEKWLKVNASCPVCRASLDGTPATS